ncbi:MAG TPA: hypothetical protein D7I09_06420 [Candidatus Poseidoniales archaeon]|nr:MAG TPA: hypothetical protein D7I09_06420 [Candidatus Poseidoniales archaeon]
MPQDEHAGHHQQEHQPADDGADRASALPLIGHGSRGAHGHFRIAVQANVLHLQGERDLATEAARVGQSKHPRGSGVQGHRGRTVNGNLPAVGHVHDHAFIEHDVPAVDQGPGDGSIVARSGRRHAVQRDRNAAVFPDQHGHFVPLFETVSGHHQGKRWLGVGRKGGRKHHLTSDDLEFAHSDLWRCVAGAEQA